MYKKDDVRGVFCALICWNLGRSTDFNLSPIWRVSSPTFYKSVLFVLKKWHTEWLVILVKNCSHFIIHCL